MGSKNSITNNSKEVKCVVRNQKFGTISKINIFYVDFEAITVNIYNFMSLQVTAFTTLGCSFTAHTTIS
ncbi:19249_t:CDS:2 [Entrophospora sp. SA101]|nr:19249_t:CDS:2 [Entrophospora sp. SA101]CAJ0908982.1 15518_t:CDS:2 [Entrophospora sp. SA101]